MNSNSAPSLSQGYYYACKTILSHFHFATGGSVPFSLDWDGDIAQHHTGMSKHQIEYLQAMQEEISRQGQCCMRLLNFLLTPTGAELRALKDMPMYLNEMYWCHQVLLPGWRADMPHKGELLGFTEQDFLIS